MAHVFRVLASACAAAALLGTADIATASPILPGFNTSTVPRNDDSYVGPVNVGFTLNFFNVSTGTVFVNNNGNITFNSGQSTYTPFGLSGGVPQPIIAPFFADVDTRSAGDPVTYGTGTVGGHAAFGVNWLNVDYFSSSPNHTARDNFQLVLVDRSDIAAGDFDFLFNYGSMKWEAGTASGGSDLTGLGGSSAHVGYSNGTGVPGSYFELAGSGVNGAFVDGGPEQLITGTNDGTPGQYLFQVRNGSVVPPPSTVPVPATLPLLVGGLAGLGAMARRRKTRG